MRNIIFLITYILLLLGSIIAFIKTKIKIILIIPIFLILFPITILLLNYSPQNKQNLNTIQNKILNDDTKIITNLFNGNANYNLSEFKINKDEFDTITIEVALYENGTLVKNSPVSIHETMNRDERGYIYISKKNDLNIDLGLANISQNGHSTSTTTININDILDVDNFNLRNNGTSSGLIEETHIIKGENIPLMVTSYGEPNYVSSTNYYFNNPKSLNEHELLLLVSCKFD